MLRTRKAAATGAAALALIAMLSLASCASPSSNSVASLDREATSSSGSKGTASSDPEADQKAFYECLREQGIDVADPDPNKPSQIEVPRGMSEEEVDDAFDACEDLLGAGTVPQAPSAADLAEAQAFSECMRKNGVNGFPDPEADGSHKFDLPIDEKFNAALEVCDDGAQVVGG